MNFVSGVIGMPRLIRIFATLTLISGWAAQARVVETSRIMISAPTRLAVEAGQKTAAQGGNVVDVAVAVGLTLSVTSPYFASLGGGGFALVKMNDVAEALDFRETAPQATKPDYFKSLPKDASLTGGHAVAVPGYPAGLWALHQKYGKLKWTQLFESPLRLAHQGFPVSGEWVEYTRNENERFNKYAMDVFFKKGGQAYKPGDILKQPGLGRALTDLRDKNLKGFYEGPVAKDIVQTVKAAGGKMTQSDLKDYKVRWLSPMTTEYEGYKLYLMPPPSSGGIVLLTALKLIERSKLKEKPELSSDEFHYLAEIQSRAFRGRAMLGDPDFYQNPVAFLGSEKYLTDLFESLDPAKAVHLKPLTSAEIKESHETTHFTVIDNEGHAVTLTVTLNGQWGSGVTTERYGIALNNVMDDFTARPGEPNYYGLIQGDANKVEPGKRPLSSMSPTLVEKHGQIVMGLGARGGPRIITGVLQVLYRVLGRGMDLDQAIQAPRVHHQYQPDIVYIDERKFSPEVLKNLKDRGHTLEIGFMGKVKAVRLRPDGILEGAYDSRGEGDAGGL